MVNPRRAAEELARSKGVALAPTAAPAPPPVGQVRQDSWVAKVMPAGAQLMADLKAQLPPDLWAAAMDNMKAGRGYVVDFTTRIGIGGPPVDRFERGKTDKRDGFPVLRVRLFDPPKDPRDAMPCPRSAGVQCPRHLLEKCGDRFCVEQLTQAEIRRREAVRASAGQS